ncbi:Homoserine kinase [Paenibacillus sp. CECT 9249]|uniref:phosphotransferase n=1 Tax=Paenibacillus sp. CECT 9249 TaxID=2845385 RepID=UPI001E5AF03A|nr:phosphotransferase [Paenibacillus sp. CECT 9249]CAH0120195.1 Homoserine kinase [Paenibacillus sp. CECT 9249]
MSDPILDHEQHLFRELQNTVADRLGMTIIHAVPIRFGYLNRKWKIRTDRGDYVLKQYSRARYREDHFPALHAALFTQNRLHDRGIPCPYLVMSQNDVLHVSSEGERFSVMTFCHGNIVKPGFLIGRHLYHLGKWTGRMHRFLNDGSMAMPEEPEPQFIPPSQAERMKHWDRVERELRSKYKTELLPVLERHRAAAAKINLPLMLQSRAGWAHRDLWTDNLLFSADRLSAILDFDRLRYDYPEADVARALMSCCFAQGRFDTSLANAFLEGYREEYPFEQEALPRSLLMLYWMECEWWIHSEMDSSSAPPARFREEMAWLADHIDEISNGRFI